MGARLDYLDTIRFVAMLMVAVCHACDPFNAGATYGVGEVDQDMFLWGGVWGSAVRACVPLFVMLTGALNLTSEMPMQAFWRKRITRLLWPFLIWAVVYNLFPWFVGLAGLPESTVYDFFVWASDTRPDLGVCMARVAEIPFRFDNLACHLWYIYMLIGLYLFTPILAAWVRTATRRQIEWVLLLWVVSMALPYMHEFVGTYLFGECEWNEFGLFHYFSGFAGYMLLGHYMVRYLPARIAPSLLYAVPAFAIGFVITLAGFRHMTSLPSPTPEQTELFWRYCSPNVMLMTTALFAALRLIRTSGVVAAAMRNFSVCCFGIYLIHYFFVGPTYKLVEALSMPTAVRVPVAAALVVACAWLVVAAIKRSFRRTTWLLG